MQAPSSRQLTAAPLSDCPGRRSVECVSGNKPGTSTHSIQLVIPASYRSRLANPDGTGFLPLSLMLALILSGTEDLSHSQYSFVSPVLVSGGGVERQEGGARQRGLVEVGGSWIKLKQMTGSAPDREECTMTGAGRY